MSANEALQQLKRGQSLNCITPSGCSISPTGGDGETEPACEFFRPAEGEDLKCKVLDEQGKRVPIRVKQVVLIVR